MSRLGVFGGTFDPIHLGHLVVAEQARDGLGLERVLFVPAGQPPHRKERPQAGPADRLAMVRLAIADNSAFAASTLEIEREGPSYTVDTLATLQRADPALELVFIVGTDSLAEMPKWHDPAGILRLAQVAAIARPGREHVALDRLEQMVPAARGRVLVLQGPGLDISATDIRQRVRQGRSIRYLVPDGVRQYIQAQGLYGSG